MTIEPILMRFASMDRQCYASALCRVTTVSLLFSGSYPFNINHIRILRNERYRSGSLCVCPLRSVANSSSSSSSSSNASLDLIAFNDRTNINSIEREKEKMVKNGTEGASLEFGTSFIRQYRSSVAYHISPHITHARTYQNQLAAIIATMRVTHMIGLLFSYLHEAHLFLFLFFFCLCLCPQSANSFIQIG